MVLESEEPMKSKLGEFCRNLRFDNGELLYDMARKLGVSSAFLSQVETGKKKPPVDWEEKIISLYSLEGHDKDEFKKAFFYSLNEEELDLRRMNSSDRDLLLEFARRFDSFDKRRLRQFIDGEGE